MRTALLPFPGDPFLLTFWLAFYRQNWRDEIDKLIIHMNSWAEPQVVEYCRKLVENDEKIEFFTSDGMVDHGNSINMMLDRLDNTDEFVVLLEDDTFVLKPGFIAEQFEKLERGDFGVIGSLRGSASQWLIDAAVKKFNIQSNPSAQDNGSNFWPSFLFTHKNNLLTTDREFGARAWKEGEMVEPLEMIAPEYTTSDTFVNTSLQLWAAGNKIDLIPQYHCYTDDYPDSQRQRGIFRPEVTHIHVGSLSSGFNGLLKDVEGKTLGKRSVEGIGIDSQPVANSDAERLEYMRRFIFFEIALDYYQSNTPMTDMLNDFSREYREALQKAYKHFGILQHQVNNRKLVYRRLWKWM